MNNKNTFTIRIEVEGNGICKTIFADLPYRAYHTLTFY